MNKCRRGVLPLGVEGKSLRRLLMKKSEVTAIIDERYAELVSEVADRVKSIPDSAKQCGDDSASPDLWEEFKYEMQEERSLSFNLYEDHIEGLCDVLAEDLPPTEVKLLWFVSDGYLDWIEDGFPDLGQLREAVSRELYSRVCGRATDEPLHPDVQSNVDELYRDRYQRDQQCNEQD